MYSRSMVRRRPGGTLWSASSSVFQPNPTPRLTRPPDEMTEVAIVFARLIGSCSTGSATAVDSRTREVTAQAVPRLTQGSRVRM